jgi:hypothetical protein
MWFRPTYVDQTSRDLAKVSADVAKLVVVAKGFIKALDHHTRDGHGANRKKK